MAQQHTVETAKAAQAFRDYVALGDDRSLEALAAKYKSCTTPVPTTHLQTLKNWSTKFEWQRRLVNMTNAATAKMLEDAAEIDADTFLATSRMLSTMIKDSLEGKLELTASEIIRIRETVRKPAPSVSVNVGVQLTQYLDTVSREKGLTDVEREQLEKRVSEYLKKNRLAAS